MRRFVAVLAASLLLSACGISNVQHLLHKRGDREATTPLPGGLGAQCGVQRWDVKTGTDIEALNVNLNPTPVTIADLASLPAHQGATARVSPTEDETYTIHATLKEYKLESDSDYHLVIVDGSQTMIVEIPYPGCVAGGPFKDAITTARQAFDARFHATGSFQFANVPVAVTGVGFFDDIHGQTGVAPNGIELHPILGVSWST